MAGHGSRPFVALLVVGLAASWFKGAEAQASSPSAAWGVNLPSLPNSLPDFLNSMEAAGWLRRPADIVDALGGLGNGSILTTAGFNNAGQLTADLSEILKSGPLATGASVYASPDNLRALGDSLGKAMGVSQEIGSAVQDAAVAARGGAASLTATLDDQLSKFQDLLVEAQKANNEIALELANLGAESATAALLAPLKQAKLTVDKLSGAVPPPGAVVGAVNDLWSPLTSRVPDLVQQSLETSGLLFASPLNATLAAFQLANDTGALLGAGFRSLLPYIPDGSRFRATGDRLKRVVGPVSDFAITMGQAAGNLAQRVSGRGVTNSLGRQLLDATAKTMVGLWTGKGVLPLSGPLKSLLALRDAVDPSATVTAFSKP